MKNALITMALIAVAATCQAKAETQEFNKADWLMVGLSASAKYDDAGVAEFSAGWGLAQEADRTVCALVFDAHAIMNNESREPSPRAKGAFYGCGYKHASND